MKFRRRNFVAKERGIPLLSIIGLIKSFSFACKCQANRIAAFPQKVQCLGCFAGPEPRF